MSFQSSDFLPVHRNGESYKATTNELKEYLQTELPFVKKSGDEMTGDLEIKADLYLNNVPEGDTWLEFKTDKAEIRHKNETKIEFKSDGSMRLEGNAEVSRTATDEYDIVNLYTLEEALKNSGSSLSPATTTQIGGVKIGSGVSVDSSGKISVSTNYASSNHTHSNYASSSHTHSGYASSSHNHNSSYVKGNYTITKTNGIFYIS